MWIYKVKEDECELEIYGKKQLIEQAMYLFNSDDNLNIKNWYYLPNEEFKEVKRIIGRIERGKNITVKQAVKIIELLNYSIDTEWVE